MSLVHRLDLVSAAQTAHRDVAVSAIANGECAHVGGVKADIMRLFAGELGVPESGAGGGELAGDCQRRGCLAR